MNSFIRFLLASSLILVALSRPSKHLRRSAVSSNRVQMDPEIVVRVPLFTESRVSERNIGSHCQNISRSFMSLFKLGGDAAATCNDGTAAGYYLLRQEENSKWLIFLEGGWFCSDEVSCKLRSRTEPRLTTSRYWDSCKKGDGIFSTSHIDNPHLHGTNMVYIPYCSSDVWAGSARRTMLGDEPFSFMGSVIIEQVVKKLIENHGMRDASVVILAGSSAGGTGVFMNIDRVQNYLKAARSSALVRGIVDSAWYLKRPEMDQNDQTRCSNPRSCSPVTMIKMGVKLWQPNIPPRCTAENKRVNRHSPNSARYFENRRDGSWKCFFGPVVYPHISAELFIVQWMFDKVQLQYDRVNLISHHQRTNQLLGYIKNLYEGLNTSFTPVKAAFVTSCFAHSVLDSSDWFVTTISGVSLADAIECWEVTIDSPDGDGGLNNNEIPNYNPDHLRHHYNQADLYNDETEDRESDITSAEMVPDDDDEYGYYAISYLNDTPEPSTLSPFQCRQKLIDPCPLPQCNPTCPTLYRQNRRINPIDFLESLGINIRSIASKKGSNAAQLMEDLRRG